MPFSIRNKTILLSYLNGSSRADNDFFIHVMDAENELIPLIAKESINVSWVICVALWTLFIVGSYYKYISYNYLFEQYQLKELTNINILTLLVLLCQHLQCLNIVVNFPMVILRNDVSNSWTSWMENVPGGEWYCIVVYYAHVFVIYYSIIGGLMIAVYRLLLITQDQWVKYIVGERKLLGIIMILGIVLTLFFVVLTNASTDYDQLRRDTCMLTPNRNIFTALDSYEQSLGNPSIYRYWNIVTKFVGLVLLLMTFAELAIYIGFFLYLYKHNNSRKLAKLLEPSVIRRRNRQNATTFFGLFCTFLFEVSMVIIFQIGVLIGGKSNRLWIILISHNLLSFIIMSIIEVFTSPVLRARVHKFTFLRIIRLYYNF